MNVFSAICLSHCTTADDCAPGDHCVEDVSIAGAAAGRVCVGAAVPIRCNGSIGSFGNTPRCEDANVLSQAFLLRPDSVLGNEFIHCPNGCEAPGDGGTASDGGTKARCRP